MPDVLDPAFPWHDQPGRPLPPERVAHYISEEGWKQLRHQQLPVPVSYRGERWMVTGIHARLDGGDYVYVADLEKPR